MKATKLGEYTLIADLPRCEVAFREAFAIELRIGARSRHRPCHQVDAGTSSRSTNWTYRPGRMAYGEKVLVTKFAMDAIRCRSASILKIRISGQIVYHANFLRFMERGRTNYLRLLGTNQHALLQEAQNDAPGFTFVVRSMTIDFLKPAVLDDVLDVVTLPQEVRGASITLLQECRRADDLLVTARVGVAFISGGKVQRIPKAAACYGRG